MHKILKKLEKKGWDKHYLRKTYTLYKKGQKKRPTHVKFLDSCLSLAILSFCIVGSMFILTGTIPLLTEFPLWLSVLSLSVLGVVFGAIIDGIIQDIELQVHHYLIAGSIIPLIGTFTIIAAVDFVQRRLSEGSMPFEYDPMVVIITYVIAFSLPHIITRLRKNESD